MSHNRIVVKKGTAILVALIILAFGVIGTGLSAFREQNELIVDGWPMSTLKVAYGFPLGWYGYS